MRPMKSMLTKKTTGKYKAVTTRNSFKNEAWWEADNDQQDLIPCKQQLPAGPKNLNNIDKEKYGLYQHAKNG